MIFEPSRPVGICPICSVAFGTREHAILCGEHSNIPKCCTAFFLDTWMPAQQLRGAGDKQAEKEIESYRARIRRAKAYWAYIPCPECLKQLRSEPIRTCNCYVGFTKPKATPPKLEYLKGHKRPSKSPEPRRDMDQAKVLSDLLILLALADVKEYALIGGAAISTYVPSRAVNDIDILLSSKEDVRRIRDVIRKLEADRRSPFSITRAPVPILSHAYGHVDVLLPEHDPLWGRGLDERQPAKLFGRKVFVASKESLIAMKKAALHDPTQRAKAMEDIALLEGA